jgi:tagaturonate reductase
MRVRVVPSIVEFSKRFDRVPSSLAFGFAAHLAFMRGDIQTDRRELGLAVPEDGEGDRVREAWKSVDMASDASIVALVDRVCADVSLWQHNLSGIDGFAAAVAEHLVRISRTGLAAALDAHLTEPASREK